MVITSNVAAVSDSNVIVYVSQPRIEPDGEYGQDQFNILVKVPSPL